MNDMQTATPSSHLDSASIADAFKRAVREAVLDHARSGFPIAIQRGDEVEYLTPQQVLTAQANIDAAEQKLKNGN